MGSEHHRAVLLENRDYLLAKAPWDREGFLQALADQRVLVKTDIEELQVRVDYRKTTLNDLQHGTCS